MIKERFGVVNEEDRVEYEKKWQFPMGYSYMSFVLEDAQAVCRLRGRGYIVERIQSDAYSQNDREIVYRTE